MAEYRLGVDIGGTHTDLVLTETRSGKLFIEKVASTPSNPSLAVMEGISRFLSRGVSSEEISFFGHGTTVTTNALLELKGSKIGLLITRGFRAVQEVQTQAREGNQFDLNFRRPPPLVSQSMTHEIAGRLDFEGNELEALDEEAIRIAAKSFKSAGIESIAVSFLFSYMNDRHEIRTREILEQEIPNAFISLSSKVLPRIREWPRLSTTLLNAYLEPVLAKYTNDLDRGLLKLGVTTPRRFLMQSNGGVMPLKTGAAGGKSVHTLLSGPAAGVQATAFILGQKQNNPHLVTMDMGGTSCDIAFISNARPLEVTEGAIDARRMDIPAFDISTISAGGGTIARLGVSGLISVGPDSAGADPGPVAYRKGGTQATVTDADLICGFLNPKFLLGGETILSIDATEEAIDSQIAGPMGITTKEAAAGIVRLINARMADEIRVQAAKKVIDLKNFTLVPFGGAGPVHAAMVGEELDIPRVLIPPNPGAFSALGLLCADIIHDYIQSDLVNLEELEPEKAEEKFKFLEGKADEELRDEGLEGEKRVFIREVDLRYAGQGYEIRTPLEGLSNAEMSKDVIDEIAERFHEIHHKQHGHSARDQIIELVSYRVRVSVPVKKQAHWETDKILDISKKVSSREVTFDGVQTLDTMVYQRESLTSETISGPAIIEQLDSTTVIPEHWTAHLDDFGNIIAERQKT